MLDTLKSILPGSILDVGCGCAHFTQTLGACSPRITAVDVLRSMVPRWVDISRRTGISFCGMDATALGFRDGSFPVVVERATLPHVRNWGAVLDEMLRVSSRYVLLEEPLDDLRSDAKRRTYEAQGLLLELQTEVGLTHFRHLAREVIVLAVGLCSKVITVSVDECQKPVPFETYFESYELLAAKSARPGFWMERRDALRSRFQGQPLSHDDTLVILAEKRP